MEFDIPTLDLRLLHKFLVSFARHIYLLSHTSVRFELLSRLPSFVLPFSSLNSLTFAFSSVFLAVSLLAAELLTSIGVGKQSAGRSNPGLRLESSYNFYYRYLFFRSLSSQCFSPLFIYFCRLRMFFT